MSTLTTEEHVVEAPDKASQEEQPAKVSTTKAYPPKTKVKERRGYKLAVRKLPIRDYTENDFKASVYQVAESLQIAPEEVIAANYIPGKMSRKR